MVDGTRMFSISFLHAGVNGSCDGHRMFVARIWANVSLACLHWILIEKYLEW